MVDVLDSLFRYGAVVVCMLMTALALRDARRQLAGCLSIALSLTTAAFLVASAPGISEKINVFVAPFIGLGMLSPVALWLFSLSLFEDRFQLLRSHWLVIGVYAAVSASYFVGYNLLYGGVPVMSPTAFHSVMARSGGAFVGISMIGTVIKFSIVGHMLLHAWRGRDDDLLESRRKFRSIFIVAGSLITLGVFFSLSYGENLSAEDVLLVELAQAGAIFVIVVYLLWNLVRLDSDWLMGDVSAEPAAPSAHCELSAADQHDLDVITGLGHSVFIEPGLTIAKMAHDTHIPEHRLRHLINQHLGYRNFSDFLNHHRVEAAKGRLSNRKERHTPVLTIAMDLGYGSLGPFNRAFKERTGQTPTEYRNQTLSLELVAAQ